MKIYVIFIAFFKLKFVKATDLLQKERIYQQSIENFTKRNTEKNEIELNYEKIIMNLKQVPNNYFILNNLQIRTIQI